MKKKYYTVVLAVAAILCSCGRDVDYQSSYEDSSSYNANVFKESEIVRGELQTVSEIHIEPPVHDMYADFIDVSINNDLINELINGSFELETKEDSYENTQWYSVVFYSDGSVIDVWRIDCAGTITNNEGNKYLRSSGINTWLSKIETQYGIDKNLLSKAPGKNYFGLLDGVSNALLSDSSYRVGSNSKDKTLIGNELKNLKSCLQGCTISHNRTESINIKFTLVMYSTQGAPLYKLIVDDEGNAYTSFGYKINSDSLNEFLINILNL